MVFNFSASYHQENADDIPKAYNLDLSPYNTGKFKSFFGEITPKTPFAKDFSMAFKSYAINASLKSKEFEFMIFKNYGQVPSATSVNTNNSIYNEDVFFGHNITVGSMKHEKKINDLIIRSQITGSMYEVNPESSFRNAYTGFEHGYKYAFSNMIKVEEQLFWKINKKAQLITGITYEHFYSLPKSADLAKQVERNTNIENTYIGTDIPVKFYVLNYSNMAGFFQFRYDIKDKIYITAGTRYDKNSRFGETINPRLGLVVSPNKNLIFKLLYGSAFLAPSPAQTYEYYGSFYSNDGGATYKSPFWHLPNPNLKPIHSKNLEFGVKKMIGENFSININTYYIWLSNLFTSVSDKGNTNYYDGKFLGYPVDYIQVRVNQGNQQNYGGTFQIDHLKTFQKGKVQSYFSVSYINGKTEKGEAEFITPLQLKAGFDLSYGKFSFSPRIVMVGKQRLLYNQADNAEIKQTENGFELLNLALRWNFVKNSFLFISVQNALNQQYFGIGSDDQNAQNHIYMQGTPQMPRRFQIGMQLKVF